MGKEKEKQRELAFQADRASKIKGIQPTSGDVLERYRRNRFWRFFPKEYVFKKMGNIEGKTICDFGCGEGVIASQLAKLGALVTAIDISPDLLRIAEKRTILDGVETRVKFVNADVHEFSMPISEFDYLVAYDVLHHVDLKPVMQKIVASLKPGGKAIIVEPISCSLALQKLRTIVPISVDGDSEDRQLNSDEIKLIANSFDKYEIAFFRLFGRFERLFPRIGNIHLYGGLMLSIVDWVLLSIFKPLSKFCGIVVVTGTR